MSDKSALFKEDFILKSPEFRVGANGRYLACTLINKALGEFPAKKWETDSFDDEVVKLGIAKVTGQYDIYKGKKQVVIKKLEQTSREWKELVTYVVEMADLWAELISAAGKISRDNLRAFVLKMLEDNKKNLMIWPAAKSIHHAIVGGLLLHTMEVVRVAMAMVASIKTTADPDICIAGAILHDIGKLKEFSVRMGQGDYTVDGSVLGHALMGIEMVKSAAKDLPAQDFYHLQFIIASHHGKKEWGALSEPATTESMIVHLADLASAKISKINTVITLENNDDSPWTEFDQSLGVRALKKIPTEYPCAQ